jgi:polysaccharide biosynthesis/export protein
MKLKFSFSIVDLYSCWRSLQRFIILLFLSACAPPVYQNTTFGIEEFVSDSSQISQGKQAVLALEERDTKSGSTENGHLFEEIIIEGDELAIVLYHPGRPDRVFALAIINDTVGFRVCNGNICVPYLSSLEVEGLTLKEAREKVQMAYRDQLPEAQIFINFKRRQERQVQIIGANHPMISLNKCTRLSEVLAQAQIPSNANLFKSYVMRNEQTLPVDLYKLIHEGDSNQNIVMQNGDQIFIADVNDATVMVTGEVPHPKVIPIPYGFLSLREALVMAGDIPFTGNKSYIQVIRGNFTRPKVYCMSWKNITHLPNQSLLLMPGDVVVISEKPITQWNRFISQIQPSATGMQGAYTVYHSINEEE